MAGGNGTGPMRAVQGFEIDNLSERVERTEAAVEALHADSRASSELVTAIRLDVHGVRTAIRLWGVIGTVAAPLLATLGAWVVLRNAAAPAPALAAQPVPAAAAAAK